MGRGLGEVQRSILEALREDAASEPWPGLRVARLTRVLYGRRPTPAQVESVRRAVHSLEARGLIELRPTLGRGLRATLAEQQRQPLAA